jgi:hypothetical protein
MTTTLPDPITNNQERVMVRNTATGFEQGVAAVAGLFTAGPIGALASWGAIRGLQGKWTPWFILGVPAAAAINVVNTVAVVSLMSTFGGVDGITDKLESYTDDNTEQSSLPVEKYKEPVIAEEIIATNVGPSENCMYPNRNGFHNPTPCVVSKRINANGHEVHDIATNWGTHRIILWADGSAEYFDSSDNKIKGGYTQNTDYEGMVTFRPDSGTYFVKNTTMPYTFSYKLPV